MNINLNKILLYQPYKFSFLGATSNTKHLLLTNIFPSISQAPGSYNKNYLEIRGSWKIIWNKKLND